MAATLDSFCRIALDAHYKSGLPPLGSVIRPGESPITIFGIIQDGLALLRTAHSSSISHFHQLSTSAAELFMLLLSCLREISLVPSTQVMVAFAEATDLLHRFRLNSELRQTLEGFVLSLSLLIGDDAKSAQEPPHSTIQLVLEKRDAAGPSSEADIISMSLLLQHLVGLLTSSKRSRDIDAI